MANKQFNWALVKSFLAELEQQLAAPLFERTGRGVIPTAIALVIAESARQMELAADSLDRTLTGSRNATTGTVRISTSNVGAVYLLPPVLAQLRVLEPGIQIELVASNQLSNLLRREADIAVRMLRPTQNSLVARKLGEVRIVAAAHRTYLERHGYPVTPADLLRHQLIGYDRDDTITRGFAKMGFALPKQAFGLRTDDQVAYGRLVASGAGIGFIAHYNIQHWPGVEEVLPTLKIPALPCWLAVHREIRSNKVVRTVHDYLASGVSAVLAH